MAPVAAAVTCAWVLTAFPVYPPAWTAPIAIILGTLAWKRPFAAGCVLAAVAVPALWNQAEASALLFAPAAILWLRAGRKWGARMWAPLAAVPLALIGIGPAIVLVAATAPTPRRRALEGAVGGLLAIVAGGTMPASATQSLAGANDPLSPLAALLATPAVAVLVLASAVFAPLLHEAVQPRDGRRGQALALWTLGFALCTVALPQGLANHGVPLLPAAFAACSPVYWRLAGPSSRLASRSGASRHGRRPYLHLTHPPQMSVLRNFERRIGGLFEGVFNRTFRSAVQPVELARKLAKEMDEHKTISIHRVYVPDEYTIFLNPTDREQFAAYETQMRTELAEYLVEHARREGYSVPSRPLVLIETEPKLAVGTFGIAVATQDGDGAEPLDAPLASAPRRSRRYPFPRPRPSRAARLRAAAARAHAGHLAAALPRR